MRNRGLLSLGLALCCAGMLSAASVGAGTITRNPAVTSVPRSELGDATASHGLMTWEWTPLCVSLITPVELPPGDWDVRGLRISLLYGSCSRLKGLDVGLMNNVKETMYGLQIGGINMAGYAGGLQFGLINSVVELKGMQIGLVNYAHVAYGLQIGLVNIISETSWGFCPIVFGSF